MYKVASDKRQSALRRGKLSDWVNGEERLSVEDQINQLKDGMRILEERIASASGDERKQLGAQKWEMQCQMTKIKKSAGIEKRNREGIAQYIVDAARELLTKSQFDLIYRRAVRDYDLAQAAAKPNNPQLVGNPASQPNQERCAQ